MRILATCLSCLACSTITTSLFAQGQINWHNTSTTLISLWGSPIPPRTNSATTYYFGLFIAPLGTPAPAYRFWGIGDTNWQFVAYATNSTAAAGRLQNPGLATVPGYAPETNVNFIIQVWQSSSAVIDWPANKWNISHYIDRSPIGTVQLGGNGYPPGSAFGIGAGQLNGMDLFGPCLECSAPMFLSYPSNAVVSVGSDVTLTAYAQYWQYVGPSGWIQLEAAYQWRKQGSPIPGATRSSLILRNVTLSDTGNYDVAAYNGDGSTLSAVATVTVFIPASAATLSSPAYNANNQFQFAVTGAVGSNYVVQVATNLSSPTAWVSLFTNAAPFTFVDSNAPNFPQRFYRAQAR